MTITDKYVLFYGSDWPSNFALSPITVDDDFWERGIWDGSEGEPSTITFSTAEAYYQSRKAVMAGDKYSYYKIAQARYPSETKKIAREIKLDSKQWNKERVRWMWATLNLKFKQNPDLMKMLVDDRLDGKKFIEASPTDPFWGAGVDEEGICRMMEMREDPLEFDFEKDLPRCQNMLGELLTKLRDELK